MKAVAPVLSMKKLEEPCETTGEACNWILEEGYNNYGQIIQETYCTACYRYRDWKKEEFKGSELPKAQ